MTIWNDITVGARLLAKERSVTVLAAVALALGIAVNTTVFAVSSRISLRDLPLEAPDRLVALNLRIADNPRSNFALSSPELMDWQAASTRTFTGIAGFSEQTMNVGEPGRPVERLIGSYISANAFALLGSRPVVGRDFRPDDDRPGADPVVILGHATWRTRYASSPDAIGRRLRVNGIESTIVGVMPEGFGYPINSALWQPLALLPDAVRRSRQDRPLLAFGRLAPGATSDQAASELGAVAAALARQYPDTARDLVPRVRSQREFYIGPQWAILLSALTLAASFVLLIACGNVANVQLARGGRRGHEMAVRLALGAARWQIVRQFLVESVLLAGVAGGLGYALSELGIRLFARATAVGNAPFWIRFTFDWPVFVFLVVVSLGTAILFGLAPALRSARVNLLGALGDASRAVTGARTRRWTAALVVTQTAMTVVLLACAGLTLRNLAALVRLDPGVETADVVRMRLDLAASQYADRERRASFYRQLDEQLDVAFGARATYASVSPLGGAGVRPLSVEGRPLVGNAAPVVSNVAVGPRYADALGIRTLRGRALVATDADVVVVNERFAAIHFPDGDTVGARIRLDATPAIPASGWLTIVGIVSNVRQRVTEGDAFDPVVYTSYGGAPVPWAIVLVRSGTGAAAAAARLRDAIGRIDPDLPVFDVTMLDESLAADRWPSRVFSGLFAILAAIALVLAVVGLYGVTAYAVSQRTREIGVRMALGARAADVLALVTGRVAAHVAIGVLLGLGGALAAGRFMQALLTQVSGSDPATFAGITCLLLLVAAAACTIPGRRAMRLDPVAALRDQ
jgi:predicted permease